MKTLDSILYDKYNYINYCSQLFKFIITTQAEPKT